MKAGAGRRLLILGFYVVLPLALLVAASQEVFDSDWCISWLSRYRPSAAQSTLELNVSRQVLATDATLRAPSPHRRVVITGSSAVVNGVDAGEINQLWRAAGLRKEAVNFGQTGLLAYELILLRRFMLHPSVDTVVFLYNSFSFADRLLATVVGVRWDTREMYAMSPPDLLQPADLWRYADGFLNEHLALLRYGVVAKNITQRAALGTLQPLDYFPDFPPEPEPDKQRDRNPQREAPASDWLRAAYVASERRSDSLGYRGFARFLGVANAQHVRVIVAPVPEPQFSRYNKWRIGTDPSIVDARIAEMAARYGAVFWPRSRVASFEADDTLFRDQTHFNRFGRAAFSRSLAGWIATEIR